MNAVRRKHSARDACLRAPGVLVFLWLTTLGMSRAAAQAEPAPPAGAQDGQGEPIDEIEVVGHRPLRDLRLEVQAARERVYDLFNSLNSDDQFDIHCRSVPKTGTRIPQRECRPQYADSATSRAAEEFLHTLFYECDGNLENEMCLGNANAKAQIALSGVPGRDQQLDEEVQRLTRENPEFRHAIAGYQTAARRYDDVRGAEESKWRVSASMIGADGAGTPSSLAARREDVDPPTAIELGTPDVPRDRLENGSLREGWVKLRYSVLADGSTADVRVVDAMPPWLDALTAIAAAQAWTFEPATEEGMPIDWHNNVAIIVFDREEATDEGWPEFADASDDVAELISSGRYAQAKSRNEAMQRELAVTLDELAYAEMQLAAIEHALGDPHAALDAIRRATEPSVHRLADEELAPALEHRFSLELELGLAADALQTYARRAALGRLPKREPMARRGAALGKALEAPDAVLAEQGRIDESGIWEHALSWRTFSVAGIDGRAEGLEAECNRNKGALPFEPDAEMTIPAGWGDCVVLVKGTPETTFVVYEFREPAGRP